MSKGIITVVGKDQTGIIARVCMFLYEKDVNILDISQTIVQDYFNMLMIVDVTSVEDNFDDFIDDINELGSTIGVDIKVQHEDIFNMMHRI